jgi:hypothetical protein
VGDAPRALDLRERADRKHLEQDVRLAEDLGIRFGDAMGPRTADERQFAPRRECTRELLAKIGAIHRVTGDDIARATGARDPWIDLFTTYLPLLLLFALGANLVVRRADAAFEPDERWLKVGALVVLALIVAAIGTLLAEMWSWPVENARLRNGHISYRAFRLPVRQHRLEVWAIGVVVFGCVVAARHLRRWRTRRTVTGSP